jgi:hypothetical protein
MPFDATSDRTETPAASLLRETKLRLAKPRAWLKGSLTLKTREDERHCLIGWLDCARADTSAAYGVEYEAISHLTDAAKSRGFRSIAHMNDDKETKLPDIIEILDEAIWASMKVT